MIKISATSTAGVCITTLILSLFGELLFNGNQYNFLHPLLITGYTGIIYHLGTLERKQ